MASFTLGKQWKEPGSHQITLVDIQFAHEMEQYSAMKMHE